MGSAAAYEGLRLQLHWAVKLLRHEVGTSSHVEINKTLDWKLVDDGARLSISFKDVSDREFSLVLDTNDVWELFLSLFGAAADALEQTGLTKADPSAVRATQVDVSAYGSDGHLVVTFLCEQGPPITLEVEREAASRLRKALPVDHGPA